MRTKKPAPIDDLSIWPECLLQVIDETTNRWRTVGRCLWTPNAIAAAIRKSGRRNVWVLGPDGRTPGF